MLTRHPRTFRIGIALAFLALHGCATIPNETPCQRATRAANVAHAAVQLAVTAGLDPVILAKLDQAAAAASRVAMGVCGVG